jgi:hypothetical protein
MLFQSLIRQHINDQDIQHVIFHNGVVFVKPTIKILVTLIGLYLVYIVLGQRIHRPLLKRVFACIGIGFFIKYLFDALDTYIDCILLSKEGVTFFARDGVFKYKTDMFTRDKIETISHTQNTMGDKMLMK